MGAHFLSLIAELIGYPLTSGDDDHHRQIVAGQHLAGHSKQALAVRETSSTKFSDDERHRSFLTY